MERSAVAEHSAGNLTITLLERRLPGGADAAKHARDALGPLASKVPPEQFQRLRLLVSEVVTNSVLHGPAGNAADEIELRLDLDREYGHIRVTVRDEGRGFRKKPPQPDPAVPGGWGLYMVDRLADRWDCARGDRFEVWFELDVRPRAA